MNGLKKTMPKLIKQTWVVNTVQEKAEVFTIDGTAVDHEWILMNRRMIEAGMYDHVRAEGYLPILDIPPTLSYMFNEEKATFDYRMEMTVYATKRENIDKFFGILINDGVAVGADFRYVMLCEAL